VRKIILAILAGAGYICPIVPERFGTAPVLGFKIPGFSIPEE